MILWCSMWSGIGWAHPSAGDPVANPWAAGVGMRTMLRVERAALEATLIAEIPQARYAAEGAGDPEAFRRGLLAGLWLFRDGERLAWAPQPVEAPIQPSREAGITEVTVRGRSELAGGGMIRLENANYPDVSCLVATAVEVYGSWVVAETTLLKVQGGQVRQNRNGAWLRDEEGRRVDLVLRGAGIWERGAGMSSLTERMEGRAGLVIPKIAWVVPVILGFALVLFSRGRAWFRPPERP